MQKILALSCCCVDFFPEQDIIQVGGNALNVAVSCAKAGNADVYLMGYVGTDLYGKKIKQTADKYGISREKLYTVEGETASNKLYLTESGEKYEKEDSWNSGVLNQFWLSPESEKFIITEGFDVITVTSSRGLIPNLAKLREESEFLLCADFMDHTPTNEWCEHFPSINLIFAGTKGKYLPLFKKWSTEFPDVVFVATLGADGSVAFKNGEEFRCNAVKVDEVIDTTGCGDSYQGAFIVEYLNSGDILSAMKAGAESAAVTLSHVGAIQDI